MDQRSSFGNGHGQPAHAPSLHASLLRLSVPARFLFAAALALFLWLALLWALT